MKIYRFSRISLILRTKRKRKLILSSNLFFFKNQFNTENKKKKKINPIFKLIFYLVFVILVSGLALYLSLKDNFSEVVTTVSKADWRVIVLIISLLLLQYLVDGLIIYIFARLYTRDYKYHRGLAIYFIGFFFNSVTPGSTGGQGMQITTMKKQGLNISHSASIILMGLMLYQFALVIIGLFGIIFKWDVIATIGTFNISLFGADISIPAIPLTILGFAVNMGFILVILFLSYSKLFHKLITKTGINLLAKLKILKNPEKTRQDINIFIENYKIELRRLFSNLAVTITVTLLFIIEICIKFSIPFFAGWALNGFGQLQDIAGNLIYNGAGEAIYSTGTLSIGSFFDSILLSSYHQMTTGIIPIPGGAGISEYFFNVIFTNFFNSPQVTTAAQIMWRFATYTLGIIVSGFVVAFYKTSLKDTADNISREAFMTYQYETYEIRKLSSEEMYHTAQFNFKEFTKKLRRDKYRMNKYQREQNRQQRKEERQAIIDAKPKKEKIRKTKKVDNYNDYDDISV